MNSSFCLQPWIGIHAWPDGSVFPCCMYDTSKPLGNINDENIQDLVNNKNYITLRQQLVNGEKPQGCNRCYSLESSGVETLRITTNSRYPDKQNEIISSKDTSMQEVKYLDIRFSNICNFKCRTCGPELSSKWGQEIPFITGEKDPGVIQIPRSKFWEYYEQALETADEIVFAGGEALMQEEHYAALQKLIQLEKFDVTLFYTTNLSTLKYKDVDLFEIWSKFSNVKIYASLDASGDRAEYIRNGTIWKNIVSNRKKLKQLSGVQFYITPTISIFNVWHFPDFYKDWVEQELLDPANIRLNILTHPPRQQANILFNKDLIIKRWQDLIIWIQNKNLEKEIATQIIKQFENVISFLKTEPESQYKLLEKFLYVNQPVDELRLENVFSVFPELKNHIKNPTMKSETFCVFPFFNINSNTDGSVKLCCNIRENLHIKKNNGEDFNLGKDSIEEIWNSDYINEVRRKMMFGEKVNECNDCYRHEQLSDSSSRTQSNKQYIDDIKIHQAVNSYLIKKSVPLSNLKSLELRLGNTCNLSCNSCWGYSSSKVNEERIRIMNKENNSALNSIWHAEYQVPKDINHWYKSNQYGNNIETVSSNLDRVYLTGGEPTLIKENRILLQKLIEKNNTECFVSFTTNGTTADSELLDLLKNFPRNEIQISIDGVGSQANYVRFPIQWNDFEYNVQKIIAIKSTRIVFYTVVSAYNLFSLSDILKYVDQICDIRPVSWYPIFLDNPSYLKTSVWSREIRLKAVTHIKTELEKFKNIKLYVGQEVFDKIFDYYTNDTYNTSHTNDFINFNTMLDKHRNTNFNLTFPELSCLI
jgi:MoaA/NifB/PqqE/SkfB family radical SAM enzyme